MILGIINTDGAFSELYTCHGNGNQRLALVEVGAGVYNLKHKHSGKCIDVQDASTADGARVIQMTCKRSEALLAEWVASTGKVFAAAVVDWSHDFEVATARLGANVGPGAVV